ncbi:MAG: helix-turn-helix domain-containing protein [Clostridia bacterium]|nr:helix-turn-helix domain-containing protein [Clostridia bacterium]
MRGTAAINKKEKIGLFNSDNDTNVHMHDFVEIVYFKSGIGTHTIDGKEYKISNGNLCIINTNTEHHYHIKPNAENKEIQVKNIIFYPQFLDGKYHSDNFINEICLDILPSVQIEPCKFIHIARDTNKDFASLFSIVEHEMSLKEEGYLDIVKNCLLSILIKIFRENSAQERKSPILLKHIEIVENAINFLDEHYNENLTLKDFADRFNFSTVYFNTIFKNYTGLTFRKYQQKLRCEKAKKMLETTDKTVADICWEVGYQDSKQFFVLFKRIVGITPSEYRKKYRKSPPAPLA